MPFSHIKSIISKRIFEARALLKTCASDDVDNSAKRAIRGHIYVTLYGMYECTVAHCVATAVDIANNHNIAHVSLKNGIHLFALQPHLNSYRDIGKDKTWARGLLLLEWVHSTDSANMENVFPSDGSFMRPSQLRLIWELFDLSGDPWPYPKLIGRIHELVESRNHIAHGTEAAGQRGGMISDGDMNDRINDIEALCIHIVETFSAELTSIAAFER
ncbi:MAE_28990/MAE_18760 family HEPN-like nuclease [Candidatus Neomarinimicrobiota bacterium]